MILKKDLIHQNIKSTITYSKNVIGLMKHKLEGKIMIEFAALSSKTYSYLIDDGMNDKKEKGTKKCEIKKFLNLMIIKIAY